MNEKNSKKIIKEEKLFDDQIEGRNSVLELLESKKDINKIFITKGEKHGSINKIIAIAKERKIIIVEKEKSQMNNMAMTPNYQGVIAIVPPYEYCEVEDILQEAKNKNEDPFILILDEIQSYKNTIWSEIITFLKCFAKILNIKEIGVRSNIYSSALGMTKYYDEKTRSRGVDFSIWNAEETEELSNVNKKINFGENSILGKLFGYFFDN